MSAAGSRSDVRDRAVAAKRAGAALAAAGGPIRTAVLARLADALGQEAVRKVVLGANALDVVRASDARARGDLSPALVARLVLGDAKIDGLRTGLAQLAAQPDLVGRVMLRRELDDGLVLERVACPLGVLGVVFESRPDALVQIAALAIKSGNGALLKGGSEALATNRVLAATVGDALEAEGVDRAAVALLEDRADFEVLLALDGVVDLVIARGGSTFVGHVRRSTRIPVMAHDAGICHLYLDRAADPAMAARIAVDAKTSYPAACNAVETLLWHAGAGGALDACVAALRAAGVELRGCEATRARHPDLPAATEADWDTEYGALVLSIKCVADLDAALAHIAVHGSRHTEAIVTTDDVAAGRFLAAVDAAAVFHNASTRFCDGYRFGLGAEVGVATGKLGARGPVGVEGLLTYRWLLRGHGQVSTDYGPGGRAFAHRDLEP